MFEWIRSLHDCPTEQRKNFQLNITQMLKSKATDCWVQFRIHRRTIFVYAVCVLGEWNNDCDMLVYALWLFRPLRVFWLICLPTFIGIKWAGARKNSKYEWVQLARPHSLISRRRAQPQYNQCFFMQASKTMDRQRVIRYTQTFIRHTGDLVGLLWSGWNGNNLFKLTTCFCYVYITASDMCSHQN